MEKNKRQVGLVLLTFQKLEKLLNLPEGCKVLDVMMTERDRMRESILVKVSGPKIPVNVPGFEMMIIPLSDIQDK